MATAPVACYTAAPVPPLTMIACIALRTLALAALLTPALRAQTYVDLDFSNNVQPTDAMYPNGSTLGPDYYTGNSLDFTDAGFYNGSSIDVRVSFIGLTDGEGSSFRDTSTYQWVGWLPDYNGADANNDLGVYYRHDGNFLQQTGGIAWTFSFFEGGGGFNTPITLPGVRFLVYDHDGEAAQSESIRTFAENGFTGYRLHGNSGIHMHDEDGSYRFDSRGEGHPETTAEGGMILYYENTSSIRFDLFATTHPWIQTQNLGIFAAWDGDLSLTDGNVGEFGEFVPVPEPSTTLLLGAGGIALLLRRRRGGAGGRQSQSADSAA